MGSEGKTILWWRLLCGLAGLNVLLWLVSLGLELPTDGYRLQQRVCAAVFVFGCAFRSVFPRVDLQRYCIVDSWLSSAFLGRTVATLAELCFALQWALFLDALALASGVRALETVSALLVPLIGLAQVFCWYGVVTLNPMSHAIEEATWTVAEALIGLSLVSSWTGTSGALRIFVSIGGVCVLLHLVFKVTVDVPMYLRRWREDRRRGARVLSLSEGLSDALHRRVVTRDWSHWREEVGWMTLYFSIGVWLSLALSVLPL